MKRFIKLALGLASLSGVCLVLLLLKLNYQTAKELASQNSFQNQPLTISATKSNDSPKLVAANLDSTALTRFKTFTQKLLSTPPASITAELLAEGEELARQRRAALAVLIKENPKLALASALSFRERSQLPPAIAQHLEERVSGRGFYGVLLADNFEEQTREVRREVIIHQRSYEAYVYGRRVGQTTKDNVPLQGIAVGNLLALHEDAARPLELSEVPSADLAPKLCPVSGKISTTYGTEAFAEIDGHIEHFCGALHINQLNDRLAADVGGVGATAATLPIAQDSWSQGPKTCLFMRVNFPDDLSEPITESGAYTLMDAVNTWYIENSYDTTTITATVTPLLTMPQPKTYYTSAGTSALLADARAAARTAGYDTDNYTWDIVRHPNVVGFNYGGLAYVHGKGVWLQSSSTGTAIHELGHNYGLWHANFWTASGDSVIGPGTHVEYGNSFDTMGAANGGINQFSAPFKNQLDWLPDSFVHDVRSNGTYRVYAFDAPSITSGQAYALKIRKDYDRFYWAELHQKFTANRWMQNGVILQWDPWSQSGGGTHLLDTTPGTPAANSGKDDAAIVIGRTFSDAGAGVHITPIAKGGTAPDNWIEVTVNLGSFPSNRPPTVSINADITTASINAPFHFTATASDADGDTLAYYWDFGDQTFGLNSPTALKSWFTAGEYVVRCVVSDLRGGVASAYIVVTVGTPGTFRISGRVTSSTGAPLEGVRLHNGLASTSYRGTYTDSQGSYTLANLSAGGSTIAAAKYGHTLSPSGSWANPVTVGPNASGINFTATATPNVSLEVTDGATSETGPHNGVFTLRRTGPNTSPLTVKLNRTGSAAYSSDYTTSVALSSQSNNIVIPAGSSALDIVVQTINDAISEGPEDVTLTLIEDPAYVVASLNEATITIQDNDPVTRPSVAVSSSSSTSDNFATESGQDSGVFTFTRSGNLSGDLTIFYAISGTAISGLDYTQLSGVVTIPDKQSSATAAFTTLDDLIVEEPETVIVTIQPSSSYTVTATSATITILDDDPTTVTISAVDSVASEQGSDTGRFTVSRIGNLAANLVVNYALSGTASNGADYTTLSGTVTLLGGQATASITVTPINDSLVEGAETVIATLLSKPHYNVGFAGSATVVIQDNEVPTITLTAPTATAFEAGAVSGLFSFSRGTSTSGDLTVYFSVSGAAIEGSDYLPIGNSLIIPAGSTSATLTVIPIDDSYREADEKVTLLLLKNPGYNVATAGPIFVTIKDNDSGLPAVGFLNASATNYESSTLVNVFVSLSATSAVPVKVNYSVTGGTATGGGVDYTLNAGTITFSNGITFTNFSFTVANDSLLESNETVIISLSSPSNAVLDVFSNFTYTILDDDAGTITVTALTATALEAGPVAGAFRINRTGNTNFDLVAYFELAGTASSPADYLPVVNFILIPAGVTNVDIPIIPVDDNTDEPSETVVLNLTKMPGGRIGSPDTATITITDNDVWTNLPIVSVTAPDSIASEPGTNTATFTISRSGNTNGNLTINFTVGGTATSGTDYVSLNNSVVMLAGATSTNLTVSVKDDAVFEADETVILTLTMLETYRVGANASALVTLLDNEVGVSISAAANASEAGLLPGGFTITRAGSTTSNLTVNFLVGGTATSGVDYAPLSNSIVIPAGAASTNLTVVPWDDALAEGTETIVITLLNGAGYTLLAPTNATILLLDDEFNLPPTVEITSPTVDTVYLVNANNWLVLEATVTDDAQPNPPNALTVAWAKVSGPGPVTFASINKADSAVKFSSNGVYVLRLTANDTQLQTSNNLTVVVNPDIASGSTNFAPVIEIGSAQNIFWNNQAYVNATVTDDGKPNPIGYPSNTWSTASGPGTATFADEHDVSTTVSFSAPGSYVLRLTSDDGQVKVFDELTVTVAEAQTISIRATNLFASEFGPVPGYFQITRVGPTNAALTVRYAFGGTASNGMDFGLLPTSLSIPAGASAAQFALTPITDQLPEGDETVIVTLQPDATYELGSSISDSVTILDQPWDAWRFAHFSASELTNAAISGELADADGDGMANLLEYAGNHNPKVADATRTLTGTLEIFPATGHPHLVVTFTRRKAPTDLTYQVQVSNDWINWSTGPNYVQELQPVQDDGNGVTETVRVRILNPADVPGFRFARLKVTRQ